MGNTIYFVKSTTLSINRINKIKKVDKMIVEKCEYGCGKEAKFSLNGKRCCSDNISRCQATKDKIALKKKGKKVTIPKIECEFCKKEYGKNTISRHTEKCFLNPTNLRLCPVCDKPIKDKNSTTCSKSCSNKVFKSGLKNPAFSGNSYQTICYYYNRKQCVVCEEEHVVDVHHLDENSSNNDVNNLIPLCPTHHRYMHSEYKDLIIDKVLEWKDSISEIENLFNKMNSVEVFEYKRKKW
jgi:hypothetical protein